MPSEARIPDGYEPVRTTDRFDADTVPAGLLKAHRIAEGVWGRLVVSSGSIRLVFEDEVDDAVVVPAGSSTVIPPRRPHRVELDGPASFAIEFHRRVEPPGGPGDLPAVV